MTGANLLVVGTRGSQLALTQTRWVADRLRTAHPGLRIEERIIKTSGDRFTEMSLVAGAGKGLFTKEIEEHLLRAEVHFAVHSLKDLPTTLPAGLVLAAIPGREDSRDVLITKRPTPHLADLPRGATVATSSLRRRAQLLAQRPDLQIVEIRGNVETRLRKLVESDTVDGTILAMAGLHRLGLYGCYGDLCWQPLAIDLMIPAVGQGLIAVEARESDPETVRLVRAIEDRGAATCGNAERAFLRAMGGGCQVPFAAHATIAAGRLTLVAGTFGLDGQSVRHATVVGRPAEAVALGEEAARQLGG